MSSDIGCDPIPRKLGRAPVASPVKVKLEWQSPRQLSRLRCALCSDAALHLLLCCFWFSWSAIKTYPLAPGCRSICLRSSSGHGTATTIWASSIFAIRRWPISLPPSSCAGRPCSSRRAIIRWARRRGLAWSRSRMSRSTAMSRRSRVTRRRATSPRVLVPQRTVDAVAGSGRGGPDAVPLGSRSPTHPGLFRRRGRFSLAQLPYQHRRRDG